MFNRYDDYLLTNFSIDYWSDEGISHGARIVGQFSGADWSELLSKLTERPSFWLIRCAETLGDIASKQSLVVLAGLLQIADRGVRIAALDSINSIYSADLNLIQHDETLLNLVGRMKESAGTIEKQMLDSLEKKLMNAA